MIVKILYCTPDLERRDDRLRMMPMELLTPHPAETAPKDGRVIRAWFWHEGRAGAEILAVSWDSERRTWVDLLGRPTAEGLELGAWGPE